MMNYKYSTLTVALVALLSGCGAEDNKSLDDDNNNIYAPMVKDGVSIPALHVGIDAQGSYTYFDPNPTPRPEGDTVFAWRDSCDAVLGDTQMLAISYPMLGEQVRLCVQPVAQGTINTIGDEVCSDPRQVEAALGEKPTAENVLLDNAMPMVGETLTGSYDYMHSESDSEGNSQLVWKMGSGDQQVAIPDATGKTLLLAAITQGKPVAFCVTPISNHTPVLRGEEVCSAATDPVATKPGTAPEADNVLIDGEGFVGEDFTGSYQFIDAEKDLEGASKLVWERDGAPISGANNSTYTAVDDDENTDLTFCVTPVAATGTPTEGAEVCSAPLTITKKTELAPAASDLVISVQSGSLAEAGEVLVAGYDYSHANNAPEGDSVGNWTVAGIAQPDCTTAQGCEYSLSQADIGKAISFAVTPKTALGTAGAAVSSADTTVMGIKLSGTLEYDQQLVAVVYGYDGDAVTAGHWMIDSANQNGPAGNLTPVSQGTGLDYIIGNRRTVANSNGNNVIDDFDWIAAGSNPVHAGSFVGKDVEFCLDTVSYGEKCAMAADFSEVTGGMFVTVADNVKRVIEPVRTLVVNSDGGDGYTYHRPLTVTEATLKQTAGFGASIPDNSGVYTANGIEWAMFSPLTRDLDVAQLYPNDNPGVAVNVCRNLYSDLGKWYLPSTYKTNSTYDGNYFAHAIFSGLNDGTPMDGKNNFKALASAYFKGDSDKLSPTLGWPVGSNNDSFPGTSLVIADGKAPGKTKNGQFHRYRFNGGNTSTVAGGTPQLLICVK